MVSFTTDAENGGKGIETIRIAGLFEFFDVERQDLAAGAKLRYGLNRRLVAVINQSARWGRIKAEVFCAMRSRYAIALYEALGTAAEFGPVHRDIPDRSVPRAVSRKGRYLQDRHRLSTSASLSIPQCWR